MKLWIGLALGLVLAGIAVLTAVVMVAWNKGGPQPTQWIEVPVEASRVAQPRETPVGASSGVSPAGQVSAQ